MRLVITGILAIVIFIMMCAFKNRENSQKEPAAQSVMTDIPSHTKQDISEKNEFHFPSTTFIFPHPNSNHHIHK